MQIKCGQGGGGQEVEELEKKRVQSVMVGKAWQQCEVAVMSAGRRQRKMDAGTLSVGSFAQPGM